MQKPGQVILEKKREMRIFLGISAVLFILGLLFGLFDPSRFRASLLPSLQVLVQSMKGHTANQPWFHTFFWLLFHNVIAAVWLMALGFFLGIFPAIIIWKNGLVVGFVVAVSGVERKISDWQLALWGIVPHGIFEIPALIWSAALGIGNGFAVVALFRRQIPNEAGLEVRSEDIFATQHPIQFALRRCARALPWIVLLLVIAALVESTLTPGLIRSRIQHT